MKLGLLPFIAFGCLAIGAPAVEEGDFLIRDFHFAGGGTLPELRIHYSTMGAPLRDANGTVRNAVLLLHGTGGSGGQFQSKQFASELFQAGQPLDPATHYIVMPDNIGHGKSSKPSDGLRSQFPKYGYRDMLETQRRLLTEKLGVNHLQLILGTSMGCMHAWMWGGQHPDFMDAMMPLACLPHPITGRNYLWRQTVVDLIRADPSYNAGNYTEQPRSMRIAGMFQTLMTSNTLDLQKRGETRDDAAKLYQQLSNPPTLSRRDANDYIWAVESSWDYDPRPGLSRIKARTTAINFADDPVNPAELGIFEREVRKVAGAKFLVMPASADTHGHGTHTWAAFWKNHLVELLSPTDRHSSNN